MYLFIYEIFRKTSETYICSQINFSKNNIMNFFININIPYLKHMIEQFLINSLINININQIGDCWIDMHHSLEDLGIVLGKLIKHFIPDEMKLNINRYGFSYIPLDDSLTRTVVDICGRSYLKYNVYYNDLYINNFNVNLFYDFILAVSNNSNVTIYIDNLTGFNTHHIFETVFKSLGRSFKEALKKINIKNSSKGIIF